MAGRGLGPPAQAHTALSCSTRPRATDQVESGVLALNMVQRISANLEMGKSILVEPLSSPADHNEIASVSLEMDVLNKSKITGSAEVECEEITKHIKSHFLMQCFSQSQVVRR